MELYEDLKIHAVLYAFARTKSRSFLYDHDCSMVNEDESEDDV